MSQFISDLEARGLAKNAIRFAVTTLRAVLNAATEHRLIEHNAAQGLGRFVKSEKPAREATSLKSGEVEPLLRAAREELHLTDWALILTVVRSGLREGELAALPWGDIHFGESEEEADRFIVAQRNYDRRWSHKMLTPKSKKPRRVDMSREVRRVLLEVRDHRLVKAFAEGKPDISDELVFPSEVGDADRDEQLLPARVQAAAHQRGTPQNPIPRPPPYVWELADSGRAPLACVRDQMAHSSIQVTVDVYGHVIPGANISYVDKLDAATTPQQSAMPPQCTVRRESGGFEEVLPNEWLGGRDSNPDTQIQSLQSYR